MFSIPLLILFGLALAAPWIQRSLKARAGWLFALVPFLVGIFYLQYAQQIATGLPLAESLPWLPAVGIELSFFMDGWSFLFSLLICFVGSFILLYTKSYFSKHPEQGKFSAFMLLFLASMLGLVTSDNLIAFFVFWEMTSIASFLLIGMDHERAGSRFAALQALLVTSVGGLALLGGFILLGQMAGTLEFSQLLYSNQELASHPLYSLSLCLILLGAFTKSAQFPFHFWLPNAMAAPTPASAYLHSATMVKAGVFLLAKLQPILGGTDLWTISLIAAGGITVFWGSWLTLFRFDLKQILAYTTLASLGLLILLIGIGTEASLRAAILFLLAHALYKAALFMIAGILDHKAESRDLRELSGLRTFLPMTWLATALACLSLASFGPVISFIAKEGIFEALIDKGSSYLIALLSVFFMGAAMLAVALKLFLIPFYGPTQNVRNTEPKEAPWEMWIGPLFLGAAGIVFGLIPWTLEMHIVEPALYSLTMQPHRIELSLWHGWNLAFTLSLISVGVGTLLFYYRDQMQTLFERYKPSNFGGGSKAYETIYHSLMKGAQFCTNITQTGYLRHYLMVAIITPTILLLITYFYFQEVAFSFQNGEFHLYEVGVILFVIFAAISATQAQRRLTAVASLGSVGFGVALIYALYSAPDLAMAQILIETLTVSLFVLILYRVPEFMKISSTSSRLRDACIATAAGASLTCLVLLAIQVQLFAPISEHYAQRSWLDAHGRNIVNVILVDYRALDTFGEIMVIGVAAIGVLILLKFRTRKRSNAV